MFANRIEAAQLLLPRLEKYRGEDGVIMAVPRGGVPLGYYLSEQLKFPLEIILTKKIGHPENPEYAIGAVGLQGGVILRPEGVDEAYIEAETQRIRAALEERRKKFMGNRLPVSLLNKIVILVDDGIATGSTLLASVELLRAQHPVKIIVAVPVAPPGVSSLFRDKVDEYICLDTPDNFMAVGQYYEDFSEVKDEEVLDLLTRAGSSTTQ